MQSLTWTGLPGGAQESTVSKVQDEGHAYGATGMGERDVRDRIWRITHVKGNVPDTHSFPGYPSQKCYPSATILQVQPQVTFCTTTNTLETQLGHSHSPTHLAAPPLTGQARLDLLLTMDCWAPQPSAIVLCQPSTPLLLPHPSPSALTSHLTQP